MTEELKTKIVWQEDKDLGKVCTFTESALNGIINEATKELQTQVEQLVYLHNEDVNTIKLLNKQKKELQEKLDFFLTEKVDGKEYRPKWELEKLEKELKAEKEYSATLRKEIDEYTNSHTLCAKYKELEKQIEKMKCCAKCSHCNTYITTCISHKHFVRLEEVCEDFELRR